MIRKNFLITLNVFCSCILTLYFRVSEAIRSKTNGEIVQDIFSDFKGMYYVFKAYSTKESTEKSAKN